MNLLVEIINILLCGICFIVMWMERLFFGEYFNGYVGLVIDVLGYIVWIVGLMVLVDRLDVLNSVEVLSLYVCVSSVLL